MNPPIIEYTPQNLHQVIKTITYLITSTSLRQDLLPKKYLSMNNSNAYFGHCHNASACLYKIFSAHHIRLMRAFDSKYSNRFGENFWHWWCEDKETGEVIDITAEQYPVYHRRKLYKLGEKSSMLGFNYKNRVNKLLIETMKHPPIKQIQTSMMLAFLATNKNDDDGLDI